MGLFNEFIEIYVIFPIKGDYTGSSQDAYTNKPMTKLLEIVCAN